MPMLGEMFDLCMLKVVQVAIILTEQAPSFSKLSFNWYMSKTITSLDSKTQQSWDRCYLFIRFEK